MSSEDGRKGKSNVNIKHKQECREIKLIKIKNGDLTE